MCIKQALLSINSNLIVRSEAMIEIQTLVPPLNW
jgi:hypothetical protein